MTFYAHESSSDTLCTVRVITHWKQWGSPLLRVVRLLSSGGYSLGTARVLLGYASGTLCTVRVITHWRLWASPSLHVARLLSSGGYISGTARVWPGYSVYCQSHNTLETVGFSITTCSQATKFRWVHLGYCSGMAGYSV